MIKQHLRKLTLASAVTVLPMLFGLIVWNRLPIVVPTHWGISGADGYSHKAILVFGMPLIMLAVFWLSIGMTALDPKKQKTK